ncbi:Metallo-hydrolase/oxidoreductase [Neolentinus lepideus HHB14362 ss-1]|uniref:Metallo-hydrolase/oxidoreductase n=1 Tax=Neolentinus lepideus HHB14362 ss-1 TaxID=1314782 RepID=A0A165RAS1_9AGAM|nr:Metallo-hydrolase/oxidoreductase [Neolentinus lepideus HHB14362 ss-1]
MAEQKQAAAVELNATSERIVNLQALVPGHFWLPDREVFQDSIHLPLETGSRVPTFSFLVTHPVYGKLLFDLGLRKHGKGYPPAWDETLVEFKPECEEDIADLLRKGGIEPETINFIVYSHLHFDHVGDPTLFPSAEIILGEDAESLFEKPYPRDPESLFQEWPEGRTVTYLNYSIPEVSTGSEDSSPEQEKGAEKNDPVSEDPGQEPNGKAVTPTSDKAEASENGDKTTTPARPSPVKISPLGPFPHVLDLFADGSIYVIDTPGHAPGHLCLLVRVSTSPATHVLLAGDCCHNRLCYSPGERLISQENYEDIDVARVSVSKLVEYAKLQKVELGLGDERTGRLVVILAHEKEREEEMPLFPEKLNDWAIEEAWKATKEKIEPQGQKRAREEDEVEGEDAKVTSKKKLKENRHKTANSNGHGKKRTRKDDEADEARTETAKKQKSQL